MAAEIVVGDITRIEVDAIVNAANESLRGGGGVDGAIHRAAGPELLEACRRYPNCPTGEVRVTPGFRLPARWVIHAAGPRWEGGTRGEEELLASAYRNALLAAKELGARSIAFPAISTGIYGFPKERAAAIARDEVVAWLDSGREPQRIVLIFFDEESASHARRLVPRT
ncbi:MAG: O-acetyl-ADP-ribose deacetylase [Candidatus Eremiobacteraeota bacterium]|nr:O-acetyl-ADP-ribose deacetylase [Candidatus Eremiobacteraeota bacterium]